MLKTIIYGGHNSRFGFVCIEQLLKYSYFDIDTIVLADFDRWNEFARSLRLAEKPSYNLSLRKRNKKQLKNIKQLLKSYSGKELRIISDANANNEIRFLEKYDLVISAAFPQIFTANFIKSSKRGVVNLHPSWLPRCRGANPVYWTIFSGEEFGGITAHLMQPEIDKGPIVARKKIEFDKNTTTYEELYQRVIDSIPTLLSDIEIFFKENQTAMEQEESNATYFRSDRLIHYKIFWKKETAEMIGAKIRAGGAFTFRNIKEIQLIPPVKLMDKTKYASNSYDDRIEQGAIIHFTTECIWIKTAEGYLKTGYRMKNDFIDQLMNLCKRIGLETLIYRIPLFDRRRLKVGQILS
ncbi:MAG: methionyl-tRNA formyltransferase [Ulvibacter sp.]|jgi:methionyl-tRNA formyltransferase